MGTGRHVDLSLEDGRTANPENPHREDALSEIMGEYMLVNHEWKININTKGEAYLLFNLKEDPDEINNLAGVRDYQEIEDQFRLRILERIASSHINEG